MPIYKGQTKVVKLYKGTTQIVKRYKGTDLIYSASRLPAEFQEVEYLESTGTQYIDTGYSLTTVVAQPTKVIADAQFTGYSSSGTSYIIGANNSGNRFGIFERNTLNYWQFSLGDVVSSDVIKDLDRHIFINDGVNAIWYVDNSNGNLTPNQTQGNGQRLLIFAYNAASVQSYGKVKLYNLKIYDNDVLIHNFVPCYRKADNVAGLYDLVNGVFYTNAGTGDFIVGGNV